MKITLHQSNHVATQGDLMAMEGDLVAWTPTGALMRVNGAVIDVQGRPVARPIEEVEDAMGWALAMAESGYLLGWRDD